MMECERRAEGGGRRAEGGGRRGGNGNQFYLKAVTMSTNHILF
jgi:hypothetical protein